MPAESSRLRMSYAEYCERERDGANRHEYLRGEVVAVADETLEHGRLSARMIFLLSRELEGRPCRVFSSDVRVRIEATDLDTYPDASVVCCEPRQVANALLDPLVVVEVLSDSTEAYDRAEKASHYRRCPSLAAYLLVAQHQPRIELQVRRADGGWSLIEAGPGERISIEPLAIELSVDEVFRSPAS